MQPGARAGNLNVKVNNLHYTVTILLLNSVVLLHTTAFFIPGSLISHCFMPLEVFYASAKWVFKKYSFSLVILLTFFIHYEENKLYVAPDVHYHRQHDLLTTKSVNICKHKIILISGTSALTYQIAIFKVSCHA